MIIDRSALEEALKQLDGDSFSEEQLASLIKAVAEMARAQDPDTELAESAELEIEVEEMSAMDEQDDNGEKALSELPPEMPLADAPLDPAGVMAELESIASAMGKDVAALLAYLKDLKEMSVGGSAAANPAALSAEVAALKSTVHSYGKQLSKYRARDEAEEKARVESEKRALSQEVDDMIAQGVIVKADASAWRSLALADAKRFRALKSTLKPVVPTGREASAMHASTPSRAEITEMPLDKSDPQVRALFDRFQTNWKVSDPVKLERLVRNALSIKRSAG